MCGCWMVTYWTRFAKNCGLLIEMNMPNWLTWDTSIRSGNAGQYFTSIFSNKCSFYFEFFLSVILLIHIFEYLQLPRISDKNKTINNLFSQMFDPQLLTFDDDIMIDESGDRAKIRWSLVHRLTGNLSERNLFVDMIFFDLLTSFNQSYF